MPVETDADIAGFFESEEFAVSATLTPNGGAPVAVTVIVDEPDVSVAAGFSGVQTQQRIALIRDSGLAQPPARNDRLAVGTETFTIRKATPDLTRRVHRCELAPVA